MELLKSRRGLELPVVYFLTSRGEIKDIPVGVPFIVGDEKIKKNIVRVLEYEVIFQAAIKTGYPFRFKELLRARGFTDIEDFSYTFGTDAIIGFSSEDYDEELEIDLTKPLYEEDEAFRQYIRDSSCYVDINKLKQLKVFPVWLDKIEEAISTNIHNFAVFNNNMYNKKLEGMYGSLELTAPNRNLIIIDISSSIPKNVSSTCLSLAKNLVESFYADLLITGSQSLLYAYEEIHTLDVTTIYEMGMGNEGDMFKALVTGDKKCYKSAIVFGDNDNPGNYGTKSITDEDGQKLCIWEVDKLISLHTRGTAELAGYSRWFTCLEEERIADWVNFLV